MKRETISSAFKKIRKQLDWTQANGEEISLEDMETQHIQNTIIMLAKKQEDCDKYGIGNYSLNDLTANQWIELFKEELKLRN